MSAETNEKSAQGLPTAEGTVRAQDKDPENVAGDWENEIEMPNIYDGQLRPQALEMIGKHSSLWNSALGNIRATEHLI